MLYKTNNQKTEQKVGNQRCTICKGNPDIKVGETVKCSDGVERTVLYFRPAEIRTYVIDELIVTDDGEFFAETLESNEFMNDTKILGFPSIESEGESDSDQ